MKEPGGWLLPDPRNITGEYMSRKIKFRVLNEYNEMVYSDGYTWSCFNADYDPKTYDFMQYTGLEDKNGKEIYEGDIIFCDRYSYAPPKWEVEWENCGFTPFSENSVCGDMAFDSSDVEIIGNIHENPKLIPN